MEIRARFLLSKLTTSVFVTMMSGAGYPRLCQGFIEVKHLVSTAVDFAVILELTSFLLSIATCRCLMNWFFWSEVTYSLLSTSDPSFVDVDVDSLYRCYLALEYVCYHLWCYNPLKYDYGLPFYVVHFRQERRIRILMSALHFCAFFRCNHAAIHFVNKDELYLGSFFL